MRRELVAHIDLSSITFTPSIYRAAVGLVVWFAVAA
jgi:hypothetical protein